ncbi:MaoC/PaaZ C-terminal domain-containing protein [Nocardioides sp.]|jgi:acyl dehydratase|uniref:MaoC/PaaZ C-terminal domain-containing protein n=1 Tax=Nocardioides sp. TaxID=35761 RepID=UPI002C33C46B|nr:MaoC/PaaZ C-terminal domain-containing protein [Nocardioides sp.]HVX53908.1 MaoC/PaaZ C-terminal domain-containing protein [Nocardioides sp.]
MNEFKAQRFTLTRADLVRYAGASGDFNPIHWSERTAVAVGLPGVIAHGMLTLGLVGAAVDTWTGGAEVLEMGARFTAPVVVPDDEEGVEVTVAATKVTRENDTVTIAMEVRCGETKVLGMPKAVVRDGA